MCFKGLLVSFLYTGVLYCLVLLSIGLIYMMLSAITKLVEKSMALGDPHPISHERSSFIHFISIAGIEFNIVMETRQ